MPDQLQQINISFVPVEDRLLLRITSGQAGALSEYRIWLTRRFVKLFWTTLEQIIGTEINKNPYLSPGNKQEVCRFQEDAALMKTDFSTPYKAEQAELPLGEEPILASLIQTGISGDGQHVIRISDLKNRGISITMTPQLIYSVRKLLTDAVLQAQWDLPGIRPAEGEGQIGETRRTIN
ncbi:MAG: hypothetical protein QMD32_01075 [Smithellaceae bacterium]|nr:hypothetical protein [Smithellaceae bacterium]